jgi:hypothetical protein
MDRNVVGFCFWGRYRMVANSDIPMITAAQCRAANALDSLMPNTTAMTLGEIVMDVARAPAGDKIDRGLILLRLLLEHGFMLVQL